MNKTITAKIVVIATFVSVVLLSLDSKATNAEVKAYIELSLQNGCPPVIDICDNNCGKDIVYHGTPVCLPVEVMKVSPTRAQDLYIALAKDYGLEVKSKEDMLNMPENIRKAMVRQGKLVETTKTLLSK